MPPSPWIASREDRDHVRMLGRDPFDRGHVVQRYPHETRHERLEALLHLGIARGRQRGDRATVERVVVHDDLGMRDAAIVAVLARDLQRRLVGLEARIAEEHLVHARQRGQLVGQRLLQPDLVDVRRMDQLRRLVGDRGHQARMVVAERVDGDAGETVEILAAGFVPQPDALSACEVDGQVRVRVHHVRDRGRARLQRGWRSVRGRVHAGRGASRKRWVMVSDFDSA